MKQIIVVLLVAVISRAAKSQSVGIGTNAPNNSAQLDVTSTSKGLLIPRMTTLQRTAIATPAIGLMVYDTTLAGFYFYNGTSWLPLNSSGGASDNWLVNGSNIYNSNTGNVGIGVATGLKEKLSVKGNLFVTHINPNDISNGGSNATINIHPATAGYARINFLNRDTTVGAYITYFRLSSLANQFSLNHGNNANQLCLDDNGNVGIGRSAAVERLDVDGNIRSRNTLIADSNVEAKGRIEADGAMTGGSLRSLGNLNVAGVSVFSGNVVGAGTAFFNSSITSNSGMTINDAAGTFTFKNTDGDKAFAQLSGNDLRVGTFSDNTAGKFIVRNGGSNNLVVTSAGNVGVGTEPVSKFHVAGRGLFRGVGEVVAIDGTSNPNIGFYNNGVFKSFISQTPTNLVVGVNGGGLQLDATQIAIGAVVPAASSYRLTVAGRVICEELKVQLQGAWPDYVFGSEYKLKPLFEVEDFIAKNKHLPNIPSAADVEKNGVEVGDMQKKLMEKIEELTLYVIELKKEIDILKNK